MDYPNGYDDLGSQFELDMDAAVLADPVRKIEDDYKAKIARGVSPEIAWQEKIEALQELLGESDED